MPVFGKTDQDTLNVKRITLKKEKRKKKKEKRKKEKRKKGQQQEKLTKKSMAFFRVEPFSIVKTEKQTVI